MPEQRAEYNPFDDPSASYQGYRFGGYQQLALEDFVRRLESLPSLVGIPMQALAGLLLSNSQGGPFSGAHTAKPNPEVLLDMLINARKRRGIGGTATLDVPDARERARTPRTADPGINSQYQWRDTTEPPYKYRVGQY